MNLDSTNFKGHCFCAVSGDYTFDEGVHLRILASQADDNIIQCTSCNDTENSYGLFEFDQTMDTLRLTQEAGDTIKTLELILIDTE